ncbi:MAG: N-acetyl-gamma-glutamyl-phosphate reductase [Candidatus Omnitrophota bacterium]
MKVAVLGATGFTGEKLVEILCQHPYVRLGYLTSRDSAGLDYSRIFPRFRQKVELKCEKLNLARAVKAADFFFLSLPHSVSMQVAPCLLKAGKKVVDLSADYRIKDWLIYKKFYNKEHKDKKNLKTAVYGLPEFYKDKIKTAPLVANPGCYPASILLPLIPLLKEGAVKENIIVDAKSSITGAGRKGLKEYHYSNISNNLWAYKPFSHQHLPEIVQVLKDISGIKPEINFVPHVVGVESGIYSTIYISFRKKTNDIKIRQVYDKYYRDCFFVRVVDDLPKLKDVVGTNFCDIGFSVDKGGKRAVLASCIDNLIKGAAGMAVQNMNIMLGFDERDGFCL